VKIAYKAVGSGEPVVLVSGLAQTGERWRRVAKLLADQFEVITVDNRETGGTGPCPEGFVLADVAQDVLHLMTELGHERFFLAGISMGGMIAQEIIRLAPDRVRAAALFSTHGCTSTAVAADPSVLMPPPGVTDPVEASEAMWTGLTGAEFVAAHPEVIKEEAELSRLSATPLEGIMRQMQAIQQFDCADALLGTPVPIVVGHGDADPLVPYANGVQLADKLGVELITYPGSGHVLESERATEVAELLRSHFLASVSR
jgi:3-oxoadipate enol-lactonase